MSGNPQQGGRYLYYECDRLANARHLSPCREPSVRADVVDPLVWGWIPARLLDAEELERGLNRLDEQRERDIQPQQERLVLIDELIAKAERKVKKMCIRDRCECGVFPTRVGVNRVRRRSRAGLPGVFPTRVGVNRRPPPGMSCSLRYSPRVWG